MICKNCYDIPEIILKDNTYIIVTCQNCNITKDETLDNISNYSSEWITNEIIAFCNSKHKEKVSSIAFCRECNIFLCANCSIIHDKNMKYHKLVKPKDLKIGFCNKHNEIFSYYCNNCNSEICRQCQNIHNTHNLGKLKDFGILNIYEFERFLEKTKIIKKEKYLIISQIKTILDNTFTKDKQSTKLLNSIIYDIVNDFYKDLKIEENLIFFAKILFVTIKKLNKWEDFRVKQYKQILEIINKLFDKEEMEKFNNSINEKIYVYKSFINNLSNQEDNIIINTIKNVFKCSNDFKSQTYFESLIKYSNSLKKYAIIEKVKNSNHYIDINKVLNNFDNIEKIKKLKNNSNFILSLLSKCFDLYGTKINVSKEIDHKYKDIELASITHLFLLGNRKKYELSFDFGEEMNQNIINIPEVRNKFLKNYKIIISKIVNINVDDFILTNNQEDSLKFIALIINEKKEHREKMIALSKQYNFIKKVEERPLFEIAKISNNIFDKKGNKQWKNTSNNEKLIRGGLKYIQPFGWIGIGLNVKDKFDDGNNNWIDKNNEKGEYAVAYLPLRNNIEENIIIQNEHKNINYSNYFNLNYYNNGPSFSNIINRICLFQNPEEAEKYTEITHFFGLKVKIILMCRINPKKIKYCENNPGFLILNPTLEEIRPYRILIKFIPSSLSDKIKVSMTPISYIISAINSKDFSFYKFAKEKRFHKIAILNKQILNRDYFTLRFYSSNYYYYINDYLREQNVIKDKNKYNLFNEEQIKSWICCLQLALRKNKNVKNNIIVYRGIRNYKFPIQMKKGDKFYFREFVSTSLNKNVAKNFIGKTGTLLIITIKNNGVNGSPNYCYNIKDISLFPGEDEILISSHCCFEINDIIKNKKEIDEVYLACEGLKFNLN